MRTIWLLAPVWLGALACQSAAPRPVPDLPAGEPVSISVAVGGVT